MPQSYVWKRTPFGDPAEACSASIKVNAQSLGWNRHAEIRIPVVPHELRAALEPGLVDRRGTIRETSLKKRSTTTTMVEKNRRNTSEVRETTHTEQKGWNGG
jgi:hypothetical protein